MNSKKKLVFGEELMLMWLMLELVTFKPSNARKTFGAHNQPFLDWWYF